jgi:DNA-binding NtrC family response regulator
MAERRILLVDDDEAVRFALCFFLSGKGFVFVEAEDLASVRELLRGQSVDVAVVDFFLPDGDGLEVLRIFKAQDVFFSVVLLTVYGTIDFAVRVIKEGVEQFFTKPVELPVFFVVIERVETSRMRACARRQGLAGTSCRDPFFGESPSIRLAAEAARVAPRRSPC